MTDGTLVFGDDGSPGADTAWSWVVAQAWPGWRAETLTATPPVIPAVHAPEAVAPLAWTSPHPRAALGSGLTEIVAQHADIDPRLLLASRHEADLLVVGASSHHHRPSLGSTADWLLLHPPVPLVIARTASSVRAVLVATDGSDDAQRAVAALASLPLIGAARVHVLAVDDGRSDPARAIAAATAALQGAADVDTTVAAGHPTREVLARINADQPDLVVLGTRGLSGWKRLRLGSTAAAVVRDGDCTTLVASAAD